MENFDDIRPYTDSEVVEVLERLLKNEEFIHAISAYQLPRIHKVFPWLANTLVKRALKKKFESIKEIADVQEVVAVYVEKILATTTSGLIETGLNDLSTATSHLFISNHRDIVMDPALISYLLHRSVHGTIQIAIGDNLLKKEYVSDLMRLNKSFIVKRSVQGREKLMASKQLSHFINYSVNDRNNVWIAQREGRAKNGIDKTDPTILKMLHLANREATENTTLKESINKLHIVPVSISYEYDPCLEMKARELFEIDINGSFVKDATSDMTSISNGLTGEKGEIHLNFGTEILATEDDPVAIALQIDRQIVLHYKLHPSNYLAYEKLQIEDPSIGPAIMELTGDLELIEQKRQKFEDMYQQTAEELKPYFLQIYANPVINKFQFKDL